MAGTSLTFVDLYTELGSRVNLDQAVTANATRLKRAWNLAQLKFSAKRSWKFLETRTIIQTVADKTAGTVSITNGSTTVTGTNTSFAAADAGQYIQFAGTTDWYFISSRSGQTLTLEENFLGTTAASSAYTLRYVFYDLGTDVDRVIDVRQATAPAKLIQLGASTQDLYDPDMNITGTPMAYALFRTDTSLAASALKQYQIAFEPIANAAMNMEIRYVANITDMSADADVPRIPQKFWPAVLDISEYIMLRHLNDPDAGNAYLRAQASLEEAAVEDMEFGDYQPVSNPLESTRASRFLPFPNTFEQPL